MSEYLSEIELYYSVETDPIENTIYMSGDEASHMLKVMRHKEGDEIFVSDGLGSIYLSRISAIIKDSAVLEIIKTYRYENKTVNISFCIPHLKNPSRFEFILEKCTELGITNFIVYSSERSVVKREKAERWGKILLSAMKQSLRSYLPSIRHCSSLKEIIAIEGEMILLDQNSSNHISELKLLSGKKYNFVFGPEGGFTPFEMNLFDPSSKYKLAENRLRTETAVIKCASVLF